LYLTRKKDSESEFLKGKKKASEQGSLFSFSFTSGFYENGYLSSIPDSSPITGKWTYEIAGIFEKIPGHRLKRGKA
jgi:hypothetical protein